MFFFSTRQVTVQTPATLPHAYRTASVPAAAGVTSYTYMLTNLPAGIPYAVAVTPVSAAGSGVAQYSVPEALAAQAQAPGTPADVYLATVSAANLNVLWLAPTSDGGASVTQYTIQWDPRATFDSNNGGPLGEYQYVASTPGACVGAHCSYVANGLQKGLPYYVRVFADNALGRSAVPATPKAGAMAPTTQPLAPAAVAVAAAGNASLTVTVQPPLDDGGAPVTAYLLEWDVLGPEAFSSAITPAESLLYSPCDVQAISATATAYGSTGYFRVAFAGFPSPVPVSVNANADDVKVPFQPIPHTTHPVLLAPSPLLLRRPRLPQAAIEAIPAVGEVLVSRAELPGQFGLQWLVTFLNSEWYQVRPPRPACNCHTAPTTRAPASCNTGFTYSNLIPF